MYLVERGIGNALSNSCVGLAKNQANVFTFLLFNTRINKTLSDLMISILCAFYSLHFDIRNVYFVTCHEGQVIHIASSADNRGI